MSLCYIWREGPEYRKSPSTVLTANNNRYEIKRTDPEYLKIFLHWKLYAFYGAFLTSCVSHAVNNIKGHGNAGAVVPKN